MRMFNLGSVSPMDGIGSFVEHWKQPTPYRWQILGLSVALTFTMMVLFAPKTERAPPEKAHVIWINSWSEGRSERVIVASNLENQKRKEANAALQKEREEFRRQFYRKLARASGMDPDQLAREYGAKDAAQAKPNAESAAKPATPQAAGPPAK
jgi:hypothetical protein